ncbi:MAG TPA: hypothetical protein VEZ90_11520 [Blastocatellia bacterium]|nr:hypothetical protein [Blastocatellia bacterium]
MIRSKIALLFLTGAVMGGVVACSKPADTTNAKPANSNAAPAAAAAKSPGAKKTLPVAKVVPVPANWIQMADEGKGYGFMVPDGTQHETQTVNGIDVYVAKTPEPSKVAVFVMAFKDKSASKEDLLEIAKKFLEGMDEKDIKITDVTELSDDYSLGMVQSTDEKGTVTKAKILVATDVTDNYIMLVGSDEKDYTANEKIIDEIWGSFSMKSGGYSGNS